jgi:IS605 OrfB family transposase
MVGDFAGQKISEDTWTSGYSSVANFYADKTTTYRLIYKAAGDPYKSPGESGDNAGLFMIQKLSADGLNTGNTQSTIISPILSPDKGEAGWSNLRSIKMNDAPTNKKHSVFFYNRMTGDYKMIGFVPAAGVLTPPAAAQGNIGPRWTDIAPYSFGIQTRLITLNYEDVKPYRRKRPHFRKYASIPYDQRLMSFKGVDRVSLLTLEGRIIVPVILGKYQSERFDGKYGQCDLVRRKDGKWFLLVTVDLPDSAPTPTTDFIGLDLGVENIAVDSDGKRFSGANIERVRQKRHKQRQALQQAAAKRKAKGYRPKSIRRKLQKASGKEARFRRNTNHIIAKQIVEKATDTGRGIGIEDLTGIRARTRFRKKQRAKMSGWSFHQLRTFIEYKAAIARVPVVAVDPKYTSQTCSQCGHREKANRKSQSEFDCRGCGFKTHADFNGALNVRARAQVSAPKVSEKRPKNREVQGQAPPITRKRLGGVVDGHAQQRRQAAS